MATCKESIVDGSGVAERAWLDACSSLNAPDADRAWQQLAAASPGDEIWHSLQNCVAYQVGVWQRLEGGVPAVVQPAAFTLALVLRHTPPDLAAKLLADLLRQHPQNQDLTSYILALVTDDEAQSCVCPATPPSPAGPAPARDLQLFSDCELAVMAAPQDQYDAHAALVRAEYQQLSEDKFRELRIKVLDQLSKIPKLFHTPEFQPSEAGARGNIEREITSLKQKANQAKSL